MTQYNVFHNNFANIGPNLADTNKKATNCYID